MNINTKAFKRSVIITFKYYFESLLVFEEKFNIKDIVFSYDKKII